MAHDNPAWITPVWSAPSHVLALVTTRVGGHSAPPYHGFNLALHVGDNVEAVTMNRARLKALAQLPQDPFWLQQVHGKTVVNVSDHSSPYPLLEADAAIACRTDEVCAVLTADCLPILLCNQVGTRVGAVHAGWRGLANGVIEAAVQALDCAPNTVLAWLGPAIGPQAFEVKEDVLAAFDGYSKHAFVPTHRGTWFADLYQLASECLKRLGICSIFGGSFCTYQESHRFYSFRREGETGRMASLVWIASS